MKIIIAIDDSPYSKQAIDSILKRHWPENVNFKILTVIEPLCVSPDDFEVSEFSETLSKIYQRRCQAAHLLCQNVRHKIESTVPGATAHYEIREGLPRIEIVDAAVDWAADKILVGAHGWDVCPHNLLGSVSRSVVHHAPCSVEIVRPQAHHKEHVATATTASKASKNRP